MAKSTVFLLAVALTASLSSAFAPAAQSLSRPSITSSSSIRMAEPGAEAGPLKPEPAELAVAARNPDRPELPEIKGDYNWDEKFTGGDDWLTGDAVPGKTVLNEIQLAAQATALSKLEDKWRNVRENEDYDDARILGWTNRAETYNGRFAMFFLVVGLLTEYWTGVTIPGQIEEMARVGGFIGPEY